VFAEDVFDESREAVKANRQFAHSSSINMQDESFEKFLRSNKDFLLFS